MEIVKREKLTLGVTDLQNLDRVTELAQKILNDASDQTIRATAGQVLSAISELQILAE